MQINADVLFTVAGFPVTNTIIATLITDIIIFAVVIAVARAVSLKPGRFQTAVESVVDYFRSTAYNVAGERANFMYPWIAAFFIFIVISNIVALFPGFETLRFFSAGSGEHGVPLLRSATSDLNTTLALAVVSVFATHYLSIKYTGFKSYLSRFFSFKMFPIFLFVGMLEIVNELAKFVSFSFRLFGNIFAGEIVLGTTYFLFPFLALELLVAVVQALVFAMLTLSFMSVFTDKSH